MRERRERRQGRGSRRGRQSDVGVATSGVQANADLILMAQVAARKEKRDGGEEAGESNTRWAEQHLGSGLRNAPLRTHSAALPPPVILLHCLALSSPPHSAALPSVILLRCLALSSLPHSAALPSPVILLRCLALCPCTFPLAHFLPLPCRNSQAAVLQGSVVAVQVARCNLRTIPFLNPRPRA